MPLYMWSMLAIAAAVVQTTAASGALPADIRTGCSLTYLRVAVLCAPIAGAGSVAHRTARCCC